MRLLGIDYGSKKIGLALSDESGQFAFSYDVIANNVKTLDSLAKICDKEKVEKIIIGDLLILIH